MFRSLVALLVALAVALLPPAAAFASADAVNGSTVVVAAADCCVTSDGCPDKSACADVLSCAAQCGTTLSALPVAGRAAPAPAVSATLPPARAAELVSATAPPPFRPPTVSIHA